MERFLIRPTIHFTSPTAKLQFVPDATIDPASAITIQYKILTIQSGGIDDNRIVQVTISVLFIWFTYHISKRLDLCKGWNRRDRPRYILFPSRMRKVSPIVNVALPVELRKETPNLFLKLNPEYSLNTETGKQAGSPTLQSGSEKGRYRFQWNVCR
jgi:hypothetical protein